MIVSTCTECLELAMRAAADPASIPSQYQLAHAQHVPAVGLTELDRQVLEFERQWWRQPGAKVQAIRDTFAVSMASYYARLNELLSKPAALEYDAVLVNRLRRSRDNSARRLRLAGAR